MNALNLTLAPATRGLHDITARIASVVREGRMALGTWQGGYLFEHRHAVHERRVVVSFF